MFLAILSIVGGLTLLTVSADRFVEAAARLARAWGLSYILIGALVIGMGTSAPEFIVSVVGGGQSFDLAVGNIVGSNIAHLSLVLGASVLVAAISNQRRILRREGVLMFVGVAGFATLIWDGSLTRLDGILLTGAMAGAAYLLVRWSKSDEANGFAHEIEELTGAEETRVGVEIALGLLTLAVMLLGANWLAGGALTVAELAGISEGLIGSTLVAVGTSLPELATAIAAARRRENELVVGNLLGSNLFNSLTVGGGVALLRPGTADNERHGPLLIMVGISALAGILTATGDRLLRAEAVVLLGAYAGYLIYSF